MLNSRQFLNVATTTATAGMLAGTMAVGGMTQQAPVGGFHAENEQQSQHYDAINASKPANVPQWDKHLSQQFAGFHDIQEKPKDAIPSRVAVVHEDASTSTMGFDKAWGLAHDKNTANDVWTVGAKW